MRELIDVDDEETFGRNGTEPAPGLLDQYHVNLVELIRRGVPEREYVPGCEGWLRVAKRYLIPAPAGTGKSLAFEVISVGIVEHGGTVAILDVENGSDEYAFRLQCILDARGDEQLAEGCRQRLRYYEWPRLSLEWEPAELVRSMAGADAVIFDSSRLALTQLGLDEDRSNDYAEFVGALLLPLAKAGITTIVLDNTGHADGERARGTKAKEDLNEIVYRLKAVRPIDIDTAGTLQMKLTRTRFGGLHRRLEMTIGDGTYEMPQPVEDSVDEEGNFRPTVLMERVADYLAENPGANARTVKRDVRGNDHYIPDALKQLVKDGFVRTEGGERNELKHYLAKPFRG
jgi:hypothetical protein